MLYAVQVGKLDNLRVIIEQLLLGFGFLIRAIRGNFGEVWCG